MPDVGSFYKRALDTVDQLELDAAAELTDLRNEIAVTRLKIHEALRDDDDKALFRSLETLRRLQLAQHRVSGRAGQHLAENMAALLEDVGELLDARG